MEAIETSDEMVDVILIQLLSLNKFVLKNSKKRFLLNDKKAKAKIAELQINFSMTNCKSITYRLLTVASILSPNSNDLQTVDCRLNPVA
jgi:hypothetical protein